MYTHIQEGGFVHWHEWNADFMIGERTFTSWKRVPGMVGKCENGWNLV